MLFKSIKKYPDIIKPVFRDKNVGITENIKEIYFVANGEYIAHMDGDDYALPGKLQIQADFWIIIQDVREFFII